MRQYMCLAVLMMPLVGCAAKPAAKITSHTTTITAADPCEISVATEVLTRDELIRSIIDDGGRFATLPEHFKPLATGTNLQTFKTRARGELEQIFQNKVARMLLYQQAKKELKDKPIDDYLEKAAEKEVKNLIVNNFDGDRQKAAEYLKKNGMTWKSFRESQKKSVIIQWYIQSHLQKPSAPTYDEILSRYNQTKSRLYATGAAIKFQLLDIEPAFIHLPDANQDRWQFAVALADRLLAAVRNGDDFAAIAEQNHGVSFLAFSEPIDPQSLVKPYDIIAQYADQLQPQQISEPIQTANRQHIFIIKLLFKKPRTYKSLNMVQRQIERDINAERKKQALDKLQENFAKQAALIDKDIFIDTCLDEIYRLCTKPTMLGN